MDAASFFGASQRQSNQTSSNNAGTQNLSKSQPNTGQRQPRQHPYMQHQSQPMDRRPYQQPQPQPQPQRNRGTIGVNNNAQNFFGGSAPVLNAPVANVSDNASSQQTVQKTQKFPPLQHRAITSRPKAQSKYPAPTSTTASALFSAGPPSSRSISALTPSSNVSVTSSTNSYKQSLSVASGNHKRVPSNSSIVSNSSISAADLFSAPPPTTANSSANSNKHVTSPAIYAHVQSKTKLAAQGKLKKNQPPQNAKDLFSSNVSSNMSKSSSISSAQELFGQAPNTSSSLSRGLPANTISKISSSASISSAQEIFSSSNPNPPAATVSSAVSSSANKKFQSTPKPSPSLPSIQISTQKSATSSTSAQELFSSSNSSSFVKAPTSSASSTIIPSSPTQQLFDNKSLPKQSAEISQNTNDLKKSVSTNSISSAQEIFAVPIHSVPPASIPGTKSTSSQELFSTPTRMQPQQPLQVDGEAMKIQNASSLFKAPPMPETSNINKPIRPSDVFKTPVHIETTKDNSKTDSIPTLASLTHPIESEPQTENPKKIVSMQGELSNQGACQEPPQTADSNVNSPGSEFLNSKSSVVYEKPSERSLESKMSQRMKIKYEKPPPLKIPLPSIKASITTPVRTTPSSSSITSEGKTRSKFRLPPSKINRRPRVRRPIKKNRQTHPTASATSSVQSQSQTQSEQTSTAHGSDERGIPRSVFVQKNNDTSNITDLRSSVPSTPDRSVKDVSKDAQDLVKRALSAAVAKSQAKLEEKKQLIIKKNEAMKKALLNDESVLKMPQVHNELHTDIDSIHRNSSHADESLIDKRIEKATPGKPELRSDQGDDSNDDSDYVMVMQNDGNEIDRSTDYDKTKVVDVNESCEEKIAAQYDSALSSNRNLTEPGFVPLEASVAITQNEDFEPVNHATSSVEDADEVSEEETNNARYQNLTAPDTEQELTNTQNSLQYHPEEELILPEGWVKAIDPSTQKPYYYHAESNITTWEYPIVSSEGIDLEPESTHEDEHIDVMDRNNTVEPLSPENVAQNEEIGPTGSSVDVNAAVFGLSEGIDDIDVAVEMQHASNTIETIDSVQQTLPEGWVEAIDPTSNRVYYYHEHDNITTWDMPVQEGMDGIGNDEGEVEVMAETKEDESELNDEGKAMDESTPTREIENMEKEEQECNSLKSKQIGIPNASILPLQQKEIDDIVNHNINSVIEKDVSLFKLPAQEIEGTLLEGWVEAIDPSTEKPYYYHAESNTTTWDRPVAPKEDIFPVTESTQDDEQNQGTEISTMIEPVSPENVAQKEKTGAASSSVEEFGLSASSGASVEAYEGYEESNDIDGIENTVEDVTPTLPDGWVEAIDPSTEKPYYYHAENNTTTWDRPEAPKEDIIPVSESTHEDGKNHKTEISTMIESVSPENVAQNEETGPTGSSVDVNAAVFGLSEGIDNVNNKVDPSSGASVEAYEGYEESNDIDGIENTVEDVTPTLPDGWVEAIDPSTEKPYYYHAESNTTTWDRPEAPKEDIIPVSESTQDDGKNQGTEISTMIESVSPENVAQNEETGPTGSSVDVNAAVFGLSEGIDNVNNKVDPSSGASVEAYEGYEESNDIDGIENTVEDVTPTLPDGWVEAIDPSTEKPYYYHAESNTTTWDRPEAPKEDIIPVSESTQDDGKNQGTEISTMIESVSPENVAQNEETAGIDVNAAVFGLSEGIDNVNNKVDPSSGASVEAYEGYEESNDTDGIENTVEDVTPTLPDGWVEAIDPSTEKPYYYHAESNTTTWDRPEAPKEDIIPVSESTQDDGKNQGTEISTMIESVSPENVAQNEETGPTGSSVDVNAAVFGLSEGIDNVNNKVDPSSGASVEAYEGYEESNDIDGIENTVEDVTPTLPDGWVEAIDPSTEKPYYYHAESNTTTWDRPEAPKDDIDPISESTHEDGKNHGTEISTMIESVSPENVAQNEEIGPTGSSVDVNAAVFGLSEGIDDIDVAVEMQHASNTIETIDSVQQTLPEGWVEAIDPTSNRVYYYHEHDNITTWDMPVQEGMDGIGNDEGKAMDESKFSLQILDDGKESVVQEQDFVGDTFAETKREVNEMNESSITDTNENSSPKISTPLEGSDLKSEIKLNKRQGNKDSIFVSTSQDQILPSGWVENFDEKAGLPFYFNEEEGISTWERPTIIGTSNNTDNIISTAAASATVSLDEIQNNHDLISNEVTPLSHAKEENVILNDDVVDIRASKPVPPIAKSKDSDGMTPKLPDGWQMLIEPKSKLPYYFNEAKNITSWEHPTDESNRRVEEKVASEDKAINERIPSNDNSDEILADLPPGWVEMFDEASQLPYYFNETKNKTTWERPVLDIGKMIETKNSYESNGITKEHVDTTANPNRNLHRQRPSCAIVSFGFGGRLCVMFPQPAVPLSSAFSDTREPVSLRKGPVVIHRTNQIVDNKSLHLPTKTTSSDVCDPLITLTEDAVLSHLEEMVSRVQLNENDQTRAKLLWELIEVAARSRGSFRSELGTRDLDGPETAIVNLLLRQENSNSKIIVQSSSLGEKTCEENKSAVHENIQKLLLRGKREEAVMKALDGKCYALAMLIANMCDTNRNIYQEVANRFAKESLPGEGSCLQTISILFSGALQVSRGPTSRQTAAMVVASSYWAGLNADELQHTWKKHLATILSNRSGGWVVLVLALGDRLFRIGNVEGSHFCYMVCGCPVKKPNDPLARLVLLGCNHNNPMNAALLTKEGIESYRKTEAFEWARRRGNPNAAIPALQPFKLRYAAILADCGMEKASLEYIKSIKICIGVTKDDHGKNLLSNDSTQALVESIEILEDRLNLSLGLSPKEPKQQSGLTSLLGNLAGGLKTKPKDTIVVEDRIREAANLKPPKEDVGNAKPKMTFISATPPPRLDIPKSKEILPPKVIKFEGKSEESPKTPPVKVAPDSPKLTGGDLKPNDNLPDKTGLDDPSPDEFPKDMSKPETPKKEKKKAPENSSSRRKGFFSRTTEKIARMINPDATVVTLESDEGKPVYDEKLKRWIFPGDDPAEVAKPLAPPPKGPIPSAGSSTPKPATKSNDPLGNLMAPPPRRSTPASSSRSRYPDPMASMGVVSTPGTKNTTKAKMPPLSKKIVTAPPKFTVFKPQPSAERKKESSGEEAKE